MMALSFGSVILKSLRSESISRAAFALVRSSSTSPQTSGTSADYLKKVEDVATRYSKHVDEAVNRWAKCDEIYYGKDRDMKNFPTVKYPLTHPKVRLGFLPDSWFQALYHKTGVTGPYLFLFGSATFLISKEIWVVDPHFIELGVFAVILTWLVKRFGPVISKRLDADLQELEEVRYQRPMRALVENLNRTVSTADEEIARSSAVKDLIKAKEENVELQLEAAFRERLQQVHRAVHRRLDYHVERENAKRRFQQQHMVDWVVNNVIKGITPAQEKETLAHCIGELKRLAKLSKAAPTP